ncbi:hypothetical protein SAMN05444274_10484 [Mariniphaga anaerophila]|uniref:HEAT repeat-containing protein n=1 Tax=Mariniphaga anaerophila TaxID=1484053 RepID=A0A1M4ZVA2_9BACT|nr:hypothetical protein [Mariniphaga anaerophila]SHF21911.1 hypothetical protein SAMN05444274_10484 [Mariniphaga anaerophila]
MENKKPNKKLQTDLFSTNTSTVLSALNALKDKGNSAYLPLLFDLLNSNPEAAVEDEIIFILYNLKMKNAVPVIAEALQNPKYLPIRKKLTTACWENGLNFMDYLPVFVDLVITEEWETSFEAFTVIENMKSYPEQEIIDVATNKIHGALNDADEQKRYLLHEILTFVR